MCTKDRKPLDYTIFYGDPWEKLVSGPVVRNLPDDYESFKKKLYTIHM